MTEFDPYQQWLGIPPEEQPPDHYRLLGLRRFESDSQVIRTATDERMAKIRAYQIGPRAPHTQKLLNQLAAAKLCLLDPFSKSEYDATLAVDAAGAVHVADGLLPTSIPVEAIPAEAVHPAATFSAPFANVVPVTAQPVPYVQHSAQPLVRAYPVDSTGRAGAPLGQWIAVLIVVGIAAVGLAVWGAKFFPTISPRADSTKPNPVAAQSMSGPTASDPVNGTSGNPALAQSTHSDPSVIVQEESGYLVFPMPGATLAGQATLDSRGIGDFLVGWQTEADTATWRFHVKRLPAGGVFRVIVEYQASSEANDAQLVLAIDGEASTRDIRGSNRLLTEEFHVAVRHSGAGSLQFSLRNMPADAKFALKRIEFSIPKRS